MTPRPRSKIYQKMRESVRFAISNQICRGSRCPLHERGNMIRGSYGPALVLCLFSGIMWSLVIGAVALPIFLLQTHGTTDHTAQQLALDP